ncbi:hypothetical protein AAG906_001992 [Vitis piasezkii]
MVKKMSAYKNRLWALELERTGVKTGRSMFFGRKMEEELSKELELQIKGAEKPFIWKLIGVRIVLLPLVCRLIKTGLSMFFECSLVT